MHDDPAYVYSDLLVIWWTEAEDYIMPFVSAVIVLLSWPKPPFLVKCN